MLLQLELPAEFSYIHFSENTLDHSSDVSAPPLPSPSDSVPLERLDAPLERAMDQLPGQVVPEVFGVAPRGVRTDGMELSNGSG